MDYLFARSLEAMTKINEPKAHEILSKAIVEVCLGEIEQIKDKYNMEQNVLWMFSPAPAAMAPSWQLDAIRRAVLRLILRK